MAGLAGVKSVFERARDPYQIFCDLYKSFWRNRTEKSYWELAHFIRNLGQSIELIGLEDKVTDGGWKGRELFSETKRTLMINDTQYLFDVEFNGRVKDSKVDPSILIGWGRLDAGPENYSRTVSFCVNDYYETSKPFIEVKGRFGESYAEMDFTANPRIMFECLHDIWKGPYDKAYELKL